jgi:hypothetical protein
MVGHISCNNGQIFSVLNHFLSKIVSLPVKTQKQDSQLILWHNYGSSLFTAFIFYWFGSAYVVHLNVASNETLPLPVYVFLLLSMFCSVYCVFVVPTGTLRIPWLRFFRAFFSVVRQMLGHNSQKRGTACTLPKLIVLFCALFVCKRVLYYHRVSTHLQLTNISI